MFRHSDPKFDRERTFQLLTPAEAGYPKLRFCVYNRRGPGFLSDHCFNAVHRGEIRASDEQLREEPTAS
jgi:hypothetical protein